jgi:hypothetical protein
MGKNNKFITVRASPSFVRPVFGLIDFGFLRNRVSILSLDFGKDVGKKPGFWGF